MKIAANTEKYIITKYTKVNTVLQHGKERNKERKKKGRRKTDRKEERKRRKNGVNK